MSLNLPYSRSLKKMISNKIIYPEEMNQLSMKKKRDNPEKKSSLSLRKSDQNS